MPTVRYPENPLLTPASLTPLQDNHEIIGVFNTGVARLGDEIILLLRVAERPQSQDPDWISAWYYDAERDQMILQQFDCKDRDIDVSDPRLIVTRGTTYLTSLSYLRVARSSDGRHFRIDDTVLLQPENAYEAFGLEDPRITQIGATYYIQYVGVSARGVCTYLATTRDFHRVERQGLIFGPENKDVTLFPECIQGTYYALHRPTSPFSQKNEMWIAESPDLKSWGNHRFLLDLRPGLWDSLRIGGGAPPIRIDRGWLAIYHGADENNRYCLGAVLLDAQEPWKILRRSQEPILEPETDYECNGFFGHVVFTCGALLEDETLIVYYGAADTSIACAEIPLDEVLAGMA